MGNVVLKGFIVVPEADIKAMLSELPNHTKLTLKEPGCSLFEVKSRRGEPCIFDVHEEFIDDASFELHQSRIKGTKWADITANVERHYKVNRSGSC